MRVLVIATTFLMSAALGPPTLKERKSLRPLTKLRSLRFNRNARLSNRSSPVNKIARQQRIPGWAAIGGCRVNPIEWDVWIRSRETVTVWGGRMIETIGIVVRSAVTGKCSEMREEVSIEEVTMTKEAITMKIGRVFV